MRWSGMDAVAGAFYYRIGGVYEGLGKYDEAFYWFKKALDGGTNQTHLFWYKTLFFAHALFIQINKPEKSLSMINTVIHKSPPLTSWEKMQVFSCKGECYEKLNKPRLANANYMSLLEIANNNPLADPYGELSYTYLDIASFFVAQKDLKKARLFLKQGLANLYDDPYANSNKYSLLFKIDSIRGKFRSALEIHILFKLYYDSLAAMDQRKKMDELTVKYAAEKKDQDIKLLKQQGIIQRAEIKENKIAKNIMIGGTILLLIIVGLLFSQFKLKQRTNREVKLKNIALQHLVTEKEYLLKEIHHRVKNNLQIMISLLNTQSKYLNNEEALLAFSESRQRMQAMSLIHQKLYQSENVAFVVMPEYIGELIEYLKNSSLVSNKIRFELDIDPIDLDISQAIPIGLVINEAVTNCIKHAFDNRSDCRICINMKGKENDNIYLEIADNGKGLLPEQNIAFSQSLGMRLICGLIEQIGGKLSILSENGLVLSTTFHQDLALKAIVV
jgi:two-component system, sensor histidine kinase PdtaS